MTRDEVIAMAREAGMNLTPAQFSGVLEDEVDEFKLEHFAALVAAAEREACARLVSETEEWRGSGWFCVLMPSTRDAIAAAIRSRSTP